MSDPESPDSRQQWFLQFEGELVDFLSSDEPDAQRIMARVVCRRTGRQAREVATFFGMIFKRGRFSWLGWDCLVDLVEAKFKSWLGVSLTTSKLIPRVRALALAIASLPDVFTTPLERAGKHATHAAVDNTVSVRRCPEALFMHDWALREGVEDGRREARVSPPGVRRIGRAGGSALFVRSLEGEGGSAGQARVRCVQGGGVCDAQGAVCGTPGGRSERFVLPHFPAPCATNRRSVARLFSFSPLKCPKQRRPVDLKRQLVFSSSTRNNPVARLTPTQALHIPRMFQKKPQVRRRHGRLGDFRDSTLVLSVREGFRMRAHAQGA